ncbi:substrate-binding domain-containing protein (plasmid) [Paraburkholderia strydomiana]
MNRRNILKSIALGAANAAVGVGGLVPPSARAANQPLKLALMAPMSGPAAFFGQACKNCAAMAIEEINGRGGVLGRPLELLVGDAGAAPSESAQTALRLWKRDKAEVFIGSHDSAVRTALESLFRGQVPYFYTPMYEGGDCAKGTFFVGETPAQQLTPVIPWLTAQHQIKRWFLIGNDYIWPRKSNGVAKKAIQGASATVVGEEYVPFDVDNFDAALGKIRDSKADAVFITLVGGSAVTFNRSFASFGLSDKMIRFGTMIEENTLIGIGASNARDLYSASSFFSAPTATSAQFLERYHKQFGASAVLSSIGESTYEGIRMYDAMARKANSVSIGDLTKASDGASYNGPRGVVTMKSRNVTADIFLAKASGTRYDIVKTFSQLGSAETCANGAGAG